MARIAPEFAGANMRATLPDTQHEGVPSIFFHRRSRFRNDPPWIPYFMNLLIIYFIGSWLPALLRESGCP